MRFFRIAAVAALLVGVTSVSFAQQTPASRVPPAQFLKSTQSVYGPPTLKAGSSEASVRQANFLHLPVYVLFTAGAAGDSNFKPVLTAFRDNLNASGAHDYLAIACNFGVPNPACVVKATGSLETYLPDNSAAIAPAFINSGYKAALENPDGANVANFIGGTVQALETAIQTNGYQAAPVAQAQPLPPVSRTVPAEPQVRFPNPAPQGSVVVEHHESGGMGLLGWLLAVVVGVCVIGLLVKLLTGGRSAPVYVPVPDPSPRPRPVPVVPVSGPPAGTQDPRLIAWRLEQLSARMRLQYNGTWYGTGVSLSRAPNYAAIMAAQSAAYGYYNAGNWAMYNQELAEIQALSSIAMTACLAITVAEIALVDAAYARATYGWMPGMTYLTWAPSGSWYYDCYPHDYWLSPASSNEWGQVSDLPMGWTGNGTYVNPGTGTVSDGPGGVVGDGTFPGSGGPVVGDGTQVGGGVGDGTQVGGGVGDGTQVGGGEGDGTQIGGAPGGSPWLPGGGDGTQVGGAPAGEGDGTQVGGPPAGSGSPWLPGGDGAQVGGAPEGDGAQIGGALEGDGAQIGGGGWTPPADPDPGVQIGGGGDAGVQIGGGGDGVQIGGGAPDAWTPS